MRDRDIRNANASSLAMALQRLTDDYAPLRALVPGTVTRDELDTTAEYQVKLASAQAQRQQLEGVSGERTPGHPKKQFAGGA